MNVLERVRLYVKQEMERTGTKQAFLAKQCGFKPEIFTAKINGYGAMRPDDLEAICRGMKITPDILFGWTDGKPPQDSDNNPCSADSISA